MTVATKDEIPVYYEEHQFGSLRIGADGAITFAYDARWLDTPRAFTISTSMPLSQERYGPEFVSPWIANLLPEERQLATIAKVLGVAQADTVAILREIGGDTAGALSFGEPSIRANWEYVSLQNYYELDSPDDALSRHFEDLKKRPLLAGEDGIRLSLAGGQQKTALTVLGPDGAPRLGLPGPEDVLAIPRLGAPSTVIIKPDNPDRIPGIVENEAYCLTLASAIGIPAVEAKVLKAGRRNALAVSRFDRDTRRDGQLRRLHQEDFAQANGVYPVNKYEVGTIPGPSLKTILGIGPHLPARDALRLLDMVIFNILVANTDAHAKNYSLLLGAQPSLSPLYDVSSVLPWKEVNQNFAQKLAGKKRRPGDLKGYHWDQIAEESGYNPRQTRLRVEELIDSIIREGPKIAAQVSAQTGAVPELVNQAQRCVEHNALKIVRQLTDRAKAVKT